MKFTELVTESFSVLRSNRMRTLLSILGIVIGIASVIALMSLGQGSQKSVEDRISSLGSNLILVSPGAQSSGFMRGTSGNVTTLTYEDAKALEETNLVTTISAVAPVYSANAQVSYDRDNTNTSIIATEPDYVTVKNVTVETGSFFTDLDIEKLSKVAVIGPDIEEDLFYDVATPIGEKIRIDGQTFTVIGVTESKGTGDDENIYIPITTAQKSLFGKTYVTSINVMANDTESMDAAYNQIGYFLLERHQIDTPEDADFSLMSQEELLETVSSVTETFTALLTSVAAISLVVGGIGIMNIMLVTVTERTREIGLRKALGAKKKTIMTQFLIESSLLTLVGGIVGLFVGIGASYFLSNAMNVPFVIVWTSVLLAVGVSAVTGIVFGIYPARKAANLLPIEALRHE